MKKQEILRNIGFTTIPLCLVIFVISWLIFRNLIGASILPLIVFIASVYSNIGKYFEDQKRSIVGVTKHKFKANSAYDLIAPNDSVAPSLCLDIGNDKYLLLNGQWLYNDEIYGDESKKYYDEESDIFNCYNKPFSFPSTEFEIWISKLDNQPEKIVVLGDYIEPKEVKWSTPEKYYKDRFSVINKSELETD